MSLGLRIQMWKEAMCLFCLLCLFRLTSLNRDGLLVSFCTLSSMTWSRYKWDPLGATIMLLTGA